MTNQYFTFGCFINSPTNQTVCLYAKFLSINKIAGTVSIDFYDRRLSTDP